MNATISPTDNVVDQRFFGGNFLFDRDDLSKKGTFEAKVDNLGIDFIRYPGGYICERWFELSNPDKSHDPTSRGGSLTPLSEFVSYIENKGHDYALVIPTIRYMEVLQNGGTLAEAKAELKEFLSKLRSGEYGDTLPDTIEVGNEYYAYKDAGDLEGAALYAEVAREFSEIIREELGDKVKIAVQAGWNKAENDIIMDAFSDGDQYVDSVIVHAYPWKLSNLESHGGLKTWLISQWEKAGIAETSYLSEWNVSNQYAEDGVPLGTDRIERGMSQAITLLEMAHGYMAAGIDLAAVWPLQQNTPGDLGGDEGDAAGISAKLSDRGLTLVGEAYRLLQDAAVGKVAIDSPNIDFDNINEDERYKDEVIVQTFANEGETVVFASAWDLQADQIGATVSFDIEGSFVSAEVVRLGSASDDKLNPNGRPVLETTQYSNISSSKDVEIVFDDPYVTYQITYTKLLGSRIMGTPQNDARQGGNEGDWIFGFQGNDLLIGKAGSDIIYGHAGNDTIRAGKDDDTIAGGTGDDLLIGARGDDYIRGSAGADVIRGGKGNDELAGGRDNDTMFGGRDDDIIRGGKGDDRLNGSLGNDVVKGGAGNDTLFSVEGNDELTGGGGQDVFHFVHQDDARVVITDFNANEDEIHIRVHERHHIDVIADDDGMIIQVGSMEIVLNDVSSFNQGDLIFV